MNKSLTIINKFGGLIYSNYSLNHNQAVVFGSTIYSTFEILENITKSLSFKNTIEFENSRIVYFKTLSGYSFVFIWDNTEPPFEGIYLHFCETILSDYNYVMNMPITSGIFRPEQYW